MRATRALRGTGPGLGPSHQGVAGASGLRRGASVRSGGRRRRRGGAGTGELWWAAGAPGVQQRGLLAEPGWGTLNCGAQGCLQLCVVLGRVAHAQHWLLMHCGSNDVSCSRSKDWHSISLLMTCMLRCADLALHCATAPAGSPAGSAHARQRTGGQSTQSAAAMTMASGTGPASCRRARTTGGAAPTFLSPWLLCLV